jgi:hypothetical protein
MAAEPESVRDRTDDDRTDDDQDDKVLALRGRGQSFVRIARDLGLRRGADATAAFNRALRRRSSDEQQQLRQDETSRLDTLARRVEQNDGLTPEDRARRLRVIEGLRRSLLASDDAASH